MIEINNFKLKFYQKLPKQLCVYPIDNKQGRWIESEVLKLVFFNLMRVVVWDTFLRQNVQFFRKKIAKSMIVICKKI